MSIKFAHFVLLAITGRSKNMTSRFASLTEQDIKKIVEDKDSQKTKRSTKVAKQLFVDYVKEKKLREPGAVYKSGTGTRGRGHRDACVGTGTWGRETRELENFKYGTRGRVGRGRGDVKNRDAGDAGCE